MAFVNIYDVRVPNEGPDSAKILVIGESPGEDEERLGRPFVGAAGQLFESEINRHGLDRKDIYLSNLSQYRPRGNKFFHLYNSRQLQEGFELIKNYIKNNKPYVIVPMGKEALNFVTDKTSITKWRGSIITAEYMGFPNIKVIPTFHPSYVLRDQTNLPTFDMDWSRIEKESKFRELNYDKREYIVNPKGMELEELTENLCNTKTLAIDIESTKDGAREIICIGFAPSENKGVSIFLESEHQRSCAQRILLSNARKIFHFGIFDRPKFADEGFQVNGPFADTFIAQQTLNAGLPNGLDYLTSIYTREPYYKAEGRAEIPTDTKVWSKNTDKTKLGVYNCKDVVCTFEIFKQQLVELKDENLIHIYDNQMEQLEMAIDISRIGFAIDKERRELFRKALYNKWSKLQWALDTLAKKELNVQSPKLRLFLYQELGLPERKRRDKDGAWKVTTNDDALVSLIAFTKNKLNSVSRSDAVADWSKKNVIITLIHRIRGIRKLLSSYIEVSISKDDRIRSQYKVAGTETGRWSCNKYIDNTGLNAQTFYRGTIEIPDDVNESKIDIDKMLSLLREDDKEEDYIDSSKNDELLNIT